ncbi:MAG: hypothetical protein A2001_14225 [Treponema sp. GWC1_61_84]|nr:MAG: hypothetical protein A2001_14225 [Treponema sp. GWC1_61_84]
MLAVLALAAFWFAAVPVAGAFVVRRSWRHFRRRLDDLRLSPILDYRASCSLDSAGSDFRFFGDFESVTDGRILWARSDNLTVPVELDRAAIYLLPAADETDDGNERASFDMDGSPPEKIRWDRVASLSEGAKVFIGGKARDESGQVRFSSEGTEEILLILYDGNERSLISRTVKAGRQKNEYWNSSTAYAIVLGSFSELILALVYSKRPALGAASSAALAAAFIPLLPLLPPGLVMTGLYRRLWRKGRAFRTFRDLVRMPLRHLEGMRETKLPDGSRYGWRELGNALAPTEGEGVPVLPPGADPAAEEEWRCYGMIDDDGTIRAPRDPGAIWAAVPGDPAVLSGRYEVMARLLEIGAMAALLAGIAANSVLAWLFVRSFR